MGLFKTLFGNKQDKDKQSLEDLAVEEKKDMIKGIIDITCATLLKQHCSLQSLVYCIFIIT
jgi:hypothetical protein